MMMICLSVLGRNSTIIYLKILLFVAAACFVDSFQSSPLSIITSSLGDKKDSSLFPNPSVLLQAVQVPLEEDTKTQAKSKKEEYTPKWKKKQTLAEKMGGSDKIGFDTVGLKGTIPVVFKQGDESKTTMALPGQPLRDVASQAGQFIKYGCGKGECGTCEAMCDGKWIRPCCAVMPAAIPEGEEYVVQIKGIKSKSTSSGTFFSVKSFFMGFYNNFLGIVGFIQYRKNAKENWAERQEYEDLIKRKTMEKKMRRMKEAEKELKRYKDLMKGKTDEKLTQRMDTEVKDTKLSP